MKANQEPIGLIHVVDDDESLRRSLSRLLKSCGYETRAYSSAVEFLAAEIPKAPACLLLDIQMPEVNGLELQRLLANERSTLPVIFISGHGNIRQTVQAMKAGAISFLTKPYDQQELIVAIDAALEKAEAAQRQALLERRDRDWFESLSERERQVCVCVAEGMLNKQIAAKFGTKEKTVKVQRGSLMKKLGARSSADIVRLVDRLRSSGYP